MQQSTKIIFIGTVILTMASFSFADQMNQGGENHLSMHQQHMMQMKNMGQGMPMGNMGRGMGRGMQMGGMGRGMGMQNMMGAQVPDNNPITAEKVALGKQLFFDPRLSKDGTISCNSCHDLSKAGADNKPVSIGVGGLKGTRNSPTVWNSSFHQAQFWDGRASSLEEQAKGPLLNPVEMAMPNAKTVASRIKAIPGYVKQFDKVFGKNTINIDNIAKAIATFERTLVNDNSRFDKFRFENKDVLSQQEKRGFQSFIQTGCMECHMGPDLAGPPPLARSQGFFEKFPKFNNDNKMLKKYNFLADQGLYQVSKSEKDKFVFRVPSLRNVKDTAPYFHNGLVKTLDEAVNVCAKLENNKDLNKSEIADISAFLRSFSGTFKKHSAPKLPL